MPVSVRTSAASATAGTGLTETDNRFDDLQVVDNGGLAETENAVNDELATGGHSELIALPEPPQQFICFTETVSQVDGRRTCRRGTARTSKTIGSVKTLQRR